MLNDQIYYVIISNPFKISNRNPNIDLALQNPPSKHTLDTFPIDEVCPFCRKACLNTFGEHAVHCKEFPGFKYRHDFVRDVLFDIFRRAGVSVKKEASVNFLTDPLDRRSTLRPADVMVYEWV